MQKVNANKLFYSLQYKITQTIICRLEVKQDLECDVTDSFHAVVFNSFSRNKKKLF